MKNNFGRINSITWQKVYDSRDNIYEPTRGRRISYTTQWAGHGLGGDFDFYKFTAEARMYKKLGAKNVLAFRVHVLVSSKVMLLIANCSHWAVLIPYVVMKMINSVVRRCTMLHWNSVSQSLKRLVAYCSLILVMHGMHQMLHGITARKHSTMALVLVFVLLHQLVQLNLIMAWVNIKINSTSASVHNSNMVNVYGEGLFFKEAFTNISIWHPLMQ